MKVFYLLLIAGCLLSFAYADPLWVRTYNGPDSTYDEVRAIGTDDSGNVIVSGFSTVSYDDEEFVTIKYRPNGDTVWLRHFNPGPAVTAPPRWRLTAWAMWLSPVT